MIVSDAVDIGYIVRRHRRHRGMSQSQLCEQADVSRRWLSDFESGKATAEIGLALRVLHALRLVMDISPEPTSEFDLDQILDGYGRPRLRDDE